MIDRNFKVKIEPRDFRKFRRRDSESDRFQYLFLDSEFQNNSQTIFVRSFLVEIKIIIFEKKKFWKIRKNDSFHPSVAT